MKIFRGIIIVVLAIVCLASCRNADTLTEEEILAFDKQDWQYLFTVLDPFTNQHVSNVNIVVSVGGEIITLTTNASGAAEFKSGFVSGFDIALSKQGYFSSRQNLSYVEAGNDRSKVLNETLYLFPDASYGTFTVQGKATVESDLTNTTRENAVGAKFRIEIAPNSEITMIIQGVTDNNGRYKVTLPSWNNLPIGGFIRFTYEAYVTDQRIAINRFSDQLAFPATLPTVQLIRTSFDPATGAISFPSVPSVYATSPAPPAGPSAVQANPFLITGILNGSGGIVVGTFGITATGGGYAAGDLPLTIVSIDGGAGASAVIRDTNANGTLDQIQVTAAGSGYPLTGGSVNKVGISSFSATSFNNATNYGQNSGYSPGSIVVNDLFFGTGTSRDKVVN